MINLFVKTRPAWRFCAILLAAGFVTSCERTEVKQTNQDIYLYQGKDRAEKLVEKAKQEGVIAIYTSMQAKDSGPLTEAFEKKYGIKVSLWRASPDKIAQRALIEAKADRDVADVLEMNGPEIERLHRENILGEFYSPAFQDLPSAAFPKHRHYVVDRLNFFVTAYNTRLVTPEQAPKTYDDLLNPRWKGKLVIEPSDYDWFAAVVKGMGEEKGLEYFKKLADMKPVMRDGHTLLAEMLASGEIPIVITAFNHSVEQMKQGGAPVEWTPLQPAFGQPSAVGLPIRAPHPHAALLFADFLLSKEGQEIIKARGRVPASRAVESALNKFQYQLIDPAIVLDEGSKWEKLWAELFLGGKTLAKQEGP